MMLEANEASVIETVNELSTMIYEDNVKAGWYTDLKTGLRKERNIMEMICLIHSEVSEGAEGYRKGLQDDKLPHRSMLEVELADTLIRIFDLAGYMQLDLGGAMIEKLHFNSARSDHKLENRILPGGKSC